MQRAGECTTPSTTQLPAEFRLQTAADVLALWMYEGVSEIQMWVKQIPTFAILTVVIEFTCDSTHKKSIEPICGVALGSASSFLRTSVALV